jgi:two-component system, NarL family, response regulator DevR
LSSTRVFVVDDHRLVREALTLFIAREDDLELAGEAATAADALRDIEAAAPDVAVLDVRLPDGDGIEVCREIRSKYPTIRCLIFTGVEDSLVDAVMAGASGYITKGSGGNDVVDAIRKVASGASLMSDPSAREALDALQAATPEARGLTAREVKVLELIGQGLTNREIADRLHLAEQTVKNYVSTLLGKLGFRRRTQAAVYATKLKRSGVIEDAG